MKTIKTVLFYISLTVVLCTDNVLPYCGNDEQIDDLEASLFLHETSCTILSTLGAIPITGAALVVVQVAATAQFGMRMKEVFQTMSDSLHRNNSDYKKCSEIMDKTITATAVIKSTSLGLTLASIIPGIGVALLPPRVASSVASIVLIRDCLQFWKKNKCKLATTGDCKI